MPKLHLVYNRSSLYKVSLTQEQLRSEEAKEGEWGVCKVQLTNSINSGGDTDKAYINILYTDIYLDLIHPRENLPQSEQGCTSSSLIYLIYFKLRLF